jgi:hypothetical protein
MVCTLLVATANPWLMSVGLLPLLKSIHRPVNLKKFEGKTLGIDAYGWLHRGTVACAMELAKGHPTRKSVDTFQGPANYLQFLDS